MTMTFEFNGRTYTADGHMIETHYGPEMEVVIRLGGVLVAARQEPASLEAIVRWWIEEETARLRVPMSFVAAIRLLIIDPCRLMRREAWLTEGNAYALFLNGDVLMYHDPVIKRDLAWGALREDDVNATDWEVT